MWGNVISKIPQPGEISTNVAKLQEALKERGYNLVIDGEFGPMTKKAVSAFQKSIGLTGTGVPGEKTIDALSLVVVEDSAKPTSGQDPEEGTPKWYREMFKKCKLAHSSKMAQVESEIKQIEKGLPAYINVASRLGFSQEYQILFAYILGCLHYKEASCDFTRVLHNGEKIVGTNKKTTLVPAGRGPFKTWQDSAVDAINFNGARWQKLREGSMDIGDILYAMERFNGAGYISGAGRADVSPYIWENSNISDGTGKYVSDGNYSPSFKLGASSGVALFLLFWYMEGDIKLTGIDKPEDDDDLDDSEPELYSRKDIADAIVKIIQRDVDNDMRETHGKNRSPRIDSFNKRTGVPMGSPYCASGAWCAVDDVCKALGLKNPAAPTASSQAFRKTSYIPSKYIKGEGTLGKKGDFGVLQNVGDSGHGHLVVLSADQVSQPLYSTVEYNTDGSGSRDGDGAYAMRRSTVDRSSSNAGKIFVCFADLPQWIIDFNS